MAKRTRRLRFVGAAFLCVGGVLAGTAQYLLIIDAKAADAQR